MKDLLKEIISHIPVDYIQARFEKTAESQKIGTGEITTTEQEGMTFRIIFKGHIFIVRCPSTLSPKVIRELLSKSIDKFSLLLNEAPKTSLNWHSLPTIHEKVECSLTSVRKITTEQKESLFAHTSTALQGFGQSFVLRYFDVVRDRTLVDSQGSEIEETLAYARLSCRWQGQHRFGKNVVYPFGIGTDSSFLDLQNRESEFENAFRIFEELKSAAVSPTGNQPCLLDQKAAGGFFHECFGHNFEADSPWLHLVPLGTKVAAESISLQSLIAAPGTQGNYQFDDEGTPTRNIDLVVDGVARAHLHSQESAASAGEMPTGHAVASSSTSPVLIRMGTIAVKPGNKTLEELLEHVGCGTLLCGFGPAQTSGHVFSMQCPYGYKISDGKIGQMILQPRISGHVSDAVQNILGVGHELQGTDTVVCSKRGMLNYRSQTVMPCVAFSNLNLV